MSALDRVVALANSEAEPSDDLLELTWSPAAREAAAASRKAHKKPPVKEFGWQKANREAREGAIADALKSKGRTVHAERWEQGKGTEYTPYTVHAVDKEKASDNFLHSAVKDSNGKHVGTVEYNGFYSARLGPAADGKASHGLRSPEAAVQAIHDMTHPRKK